MNFKAGDFLTASVGNYKGDIFKVIAVDQDIIAVEHLIDRFFGYGLTNKQKIFHESEINFRKVSDDFVYSIRPELKPINFDPETLEII